MAESPFGNVNRVLPRSSSTIKLVDLAVGTHVIEVKPKSNLIVVVSSASGTANIEYTYDTERPLTDGVAPPSEGFATGVISRTWTTGASAAAQETIVGPVTAVRVTVATAVASVVLAPQD